MIADGEATRPWDDGSNASATSPTRGAVPTRDLRGNDPEPLGIDPGEEPRRLRASPADRRHGPPVCETARHEQRPTAAARERAARTPVTTCARVLGPDATPSPLLGDNGR